MFKKKQTKEQIEISNNEFSEYEVPMEKEEKKKPSKLQKFSLFTSFLGALFFVFNIITSATKYKESKLFPYILVFSIGYIIIFFIFLIVHRKNSKDIKKDEKNFKASYKLVKAILNLFFLASSLLIFYESLQTINTLGFFAAFNLVFSGILLVFKLLSTIGKIIKIIKKRRKQLKKAKAKNNK